MSKLTAEEILFKYTEKDGETLPITIPKSLKAMEEYHALKLQEYKEGIYDNVITMFETLRFNKDHHLGLGDIRLTRGQQEEIENLILNKQ